MAGYNALAYCYDRFFSQEDLARIHGIYEALLRKNGALPPSRVLDVGCGTGLLSFALIARGYDVYGIDLSGDMIATAKAKAADLHADPARFTVADAADFRLGQRFSAAVSSLDVVNHIVSPQQLQAAFQNICGHLHAGGVYIFDVNTKKRFKTEYGENRYIYEVDGCYCVWQNHYDPRTRACRMETTVFELEGDRYWRADEAFYERYYSDAMLRKILRYAGFRRVRSTCTERGCRRIYVASA